MAETPMNGIPPEYQAELQQLMRRRQMAQQMAMMGLQAPATEMVGNHVVRQSPLQHIARLATGFLGHKATEQADTGMAGIQQQIAQARQKQLQGLQADPTPGLTSMDPTVRGVAEALMKSRDARAGKAADVVGQTDPAAALQAIRTGQVPGEGYKPPPPAAPTFGDFQGNPYALIPQPGGKTDFRFAPKGVNVNNVLPGKEADMALDATKADLKTRQERAQAAKEILFSNRTALDALNTGAQTGGLEGFKQSLRKIGQGFGIELPETAPTEQLQMALGNAVLAKARALAPVTAEDVKRLEKILGSVDTDPQALEKMLAVYNGLAMKELQDYNRYVTEQKDSLKSDYAKQLFGGAGVGYEMMPPPGNTQQALRAIQEMQSRGGDVSQFAIGGERVSPDSTFKMNSSSAPQTKAPAPAPAAKKPADLSDQEWTRLQELRKKYGR